MSRKYQGGYSAPDGDGGRPPLPTTGSGVRKLADVTDVHRIGSAVTASEALKLLEKASRVVAVVAVAPGIGHHFEITKDEALRRVAKLRYCRVICELDSDGLCWIGSTVMP